MYYEGTISWQKYLQEPGKHSDLQPQHIDKSSTLILPKATLLSQMTFPLNNGHSYGPNDVLTVC